MWSATIRLRLLAAVIGCTAFLAGVLEGPRPALLAEEPLTIEVTSAGDASSGACPHLTNCTLRKAIEAVNADSSAAPFVIRFKAVTFPLESPSTITLLAAPLPPIVRARVTLDATGRGVWLDGAQLPGTGPVDAIVLSGSEANVWGMSIHNFSGRCLALTGASSHAGGSTAEGKGNRIGACATGLAIGGSLSTAEGNRIGFALGTSDPAHVETGILVTASAVVVGGPDAATRGNLIGNSGTAIKVGDGTGAAFAGVQLAGNAIGRSPGGAAAPVTIGIELRQPGSRTRADENTIANAITGISVAPPTNSIPVSGNTFVGNRFDSLSGMAIDLNADGVRNSNHPAIARATQARISGTAGPCSGCKVALYLATHQPGSVGDYGSTPVAGGTMITDAGGNFQFENLGLSPGQWLIALATDSDGNTSEFGPSARVGTGVVQCANQPLPPGWNHTGYFGSGTATLGNSYPPGTNQVSAIHHFTDGSTGFSSWFASSSEGRTLYSLTPGEAYWFYAREPVAASGGFTLTVPVPVELKAGWNDFTYIGATADVRDALASITGRYTSVYRFLNNGTSARWQAWGDPATPDFVRAFTTLESCGVYEVFVTSDVTLTPLQP